MVLRPVPRACPRESAILSRVVRAERLRYHWTNHAREEMAHDSIIEADIRHVLSKGPVCWVEFKADEIWHVDGTDIDGRKIRVVVAVSDASTTIKVITTMAL